MPYAGAEVVWAAREEMARTVEDVLARHTRALFLNARAAVEMAPQVAALMAREPGRRLGGSPGAGIQQDGSRFSARSALGERAGRLGNGGQRRRI